jgi:hypothetical protein
MITNSEDMTQKPMTTVSGVLEKLRIRNQDTEFIVDEIGFTAGKGKHYTPDELSIIKTYRFEGDSDPSDTSIIFLIEANDGLIGYCMDAYGVYTNQNDAFNTLITQIKVKR